jgi:hypothetical protein
MEFRATINLPSSCMSPCSGGISRWTHIFNFSQATQFATPAPRQPALPPSPHGSLIHIIRLHLLSAARESSLPDQGEGNIYSSAVNEEIRLKICPCPHHCFSPTIYFIWPYIFISTMWQCKHSDILHLLITDMQLHCYTYTECTKY